LEPSGYNESLLVPDGWDGDGVIARIRDQQLAAQLREIGKPTVNVSGVVLAGVNWPRVVSDETEIAAAALTHLRERGFRKFAFYGPAAMPYVRQRGELFMQLVRQAGFECDIYGAANGDPANPGWAQLQSDLARWLEGLSKPVGVMTWNALESRRVSDACRVCGFRVPEDVALISVDTDELVSEMIFPTLSGVQMSTEKIGYEAARLLHQMVLGQKSESQTVQVPIQGIVTRQSTDVLAVEDPALLIAAKFIRDNAHKPISALDVARAADVSRRDLERKFRESLGTSPARQIRRAHVDRAKELLAQTNLKITKVAQMSGFNHVERMIVTFRSATGFTPLAYRKHRQMEPAK
jgi:LacI family transcriptional regulator